MLRGGGRGSYIGGWEIWHHITFFKKGNISSADQPGVSQESKSPVESAPLGKRGEEENDNVEYVPESLETKDPALEAFSNVFARFQLPPDGKPVRNPEKLSAPLLMLVLQVSLENRSYKSRDHLLGRRDVIRRRLGC